MIQKPTKKSDEFQKNSIHNIYEPMQMKLGKTYYWRIDAVLQDKIITGHVWKFTVLDE